ncbi:MAG: peptidoglycan-associated lipoprotein Pal [bacterium]
MLKKIMVIGLMLVISGAFVSCAKKQIIQEPEIEKAEEIEVEEPAVRGKEFQNIDELAVVNFDYDKSDLRSDAREILKANAEFLKKNTNLEVLVEGHCDERGSLEYNLALGQRRAAVVRTYYIQLGVAANKITTISYGEERPVSAGTSEYAYSKNRRAETLARSGL